MYQVMYQVMYQAIPGTDLIGKYKGVPDRGSRNGF
jgi:hypothetical protein